MKRNKYNGQFIQENLYERFSKYVEVNNNCWIWHGSFNGNGIPKFHINRNGVSARRFAYKSILGNLPKNKIVVNNCENKLCISPYHSKLKNRKECLEQFFNTKKLYCKYNHLMESINVYYRKDGRRDCRTCQRNKEKIRRDLRRDYKRLERWPRVARKHAEPRN